MTKSKKKPLRPMGEILLDLETILEEMVDEHQLQAGDILYDVYGWIETHRPEALERYTMDSSNPVLRYRHRDDYK